MNPPILLITFLMLFATSAFAQIPQTMSYQGLLTDAAGNAVADGPVDLTFKLYDAATDGAMLWQERQQVEVANGLFNVILGTSNPLNLPFDKPYWLGSTIGTDAELQPRMALTSSPYSLSSQTSGNAGDGHSLDAADGDPTDVMFVSEDGKVGIGTREPEGVLEINLTRSNNAAAGVATVGSSTVQFIDPILRVALNGEPLFEVSAERKVLLAENMSLGIGTTTPQAYLDIAYPPNPVMPAFRVMEQGASAPSFYISKEGMVGIANRTPAEVLDVVGNIKASGKVFASAYSSNSPFIMEAPASTISPAILASVRPRRRKNST